MAAHQRIASFKRPPSSLKGGGATSRPHLFWEAEQLLYIGWGCSLRVRARERTVQKVDPCGLAGPEPCNHDGQDRILCEFAISEENLMPMLQVARVTTRQTQGSSMQREPQRELQTVATFDMADAILVR